MIKLEVRKDIEEMFKEYRKHKYYTLFMESVDTSITSSIDEIGGGQSNKVSDKVGDAAIRLVDALAEAKACVELIEFAVDQLPGVEKELIQLRYMTKDYSYLNDYIVYNNKMTNPISAPYYNKLRLRAFDKLQVMLLSNV